MVLKVAGLQDRQRRQPYKAEAAVNISKGSTRAAKQASEISALLAMMLYKSCYDKLVPPCLVIATSLSLGHQETLVATDHIDTELAPKTTKTTGGRDTSFLYQCQPSIQAAKRISSICKARPSTELCYICVRIA